MKLTLYMGVTLNGYIAKEEGDTPWCQALWDSYYAIAKRFRAIVLGRKTYETMRKAKEFERIGRPFVVVVSKKERGDGDATFVTSPEQAVQALKKAGFSKALVGGGGKLNASFMRDGLIDEIILDIEPQIFGKGVKLFADGAFEARLRLLRTKPLSRDAIQVRYEVIR